MHTILLSLGIASLLLGALAGADFVAGNRSIASLAGASRQSGSDSPAISVLIPARNEERNIREALQSVLKQDYPHMEYIVLNDRSTDRTGDILAEMSRQDPRLRVVEIRELPSGWLGKNYALFQGAGAATGELLLFADADIVMDPSVCARAVNYFREHRLDHLTIMPEVSMPGVLLRMFTSSFGVFFSLYARPWKAKTPRAGALWAWGLNLIRAEAYRASGTHRAIAMRPDDDLKLGKLLKRSGFRQEMIFGVGLLRVEWYASLGEVIDGLMKNSFAGVGYSLVASLAAGLAVLVFHVWPFVAIFCTHGAVRNLLNLLLAAMILLLVAEGNRVYGLRAWYAIGHPLCSVLFTYILWRSTVTTLWNGGITWRGTHYPLALLRANKV